MLTESGWASMHSAHLQRDRVAQCEAIGNGYTTRADTVHSNAPARVVLGRKPVGGLPPLAVLTDDRRHPFVLLRQYIPEADHLPCARMRFAAFFAPAHEMLSLERPPGRLDGTVFAEFAALRPRVLQPVRNPSPLARHLVLHRLLARAPCSAGIGLTCRLREPFAFPLQNPAKPLGVRPHLLNSAGIDEGRDLRPVSVVPLHAFVHQVPAPGPGGSACCYWNGYGTQCNHPLKSLIYTHFSWSVQSPFGKWKVSASRT